MFQQPDRAWAKEDLRALTGRARDGIARVSADLPGAKEEILTHLESPSQRSRQVSSANPVERLIEKINRRTWVVGIHREERGVICLIGLRPPSKMTNGRVPHGAVIPSRRNQA